MRALSGPQKSPPSANGIFHYLICHVETYDVAALYKEIARVVDTPTIISHADALDAFFQSNYNPKQDIFAYLSELSTHVAKINDMNKQLPTTAGVEIPDSLIRAKLIKAMSTVPIFKTLVDNLLVQDPAEWAKLTESTLQAARNGSS